jgi:IclR family acetate operon transcriptional repressor
MESRALAKGLQILEILAAARESVSLGALSKRVGLGKASTYRLLQTLAKAGHVVQHDDQTYAIRRDVSPPASADLIASLLRAACADMEFLNAEVSETVTLAMLREDHIRVVHTIESPHHIRLYNPVGRIIAPYASSLGKAVAAWQPPEMLNLLIKVYGIYQITEHTITDPNAIRQEMARIRERGYASEKEETVVGGCCYGAPIFGPGNDVKAAISVAMPLIRFTPELDIRIPEALCAATARISKRLGGRQ